MDDDPFNFKWPSQGSQQSRGNPQQLWHERRPPSPSPSAPGPGSNETPGTFSHQCHPFGTRFTCMKEFVWDSEQRYDEDHPTYIRYLFQWKVMKNGRGVAKGEGTLAEQQVQPFHGHIRDPDANTSNDASQRQHWLSGLGTVRSKTIGPHPVSVITRPSLNHRVGIFVALRRRLEMQVASCVCFDRYAEPHPSQPHRLGI